MGEDSPGAGAQVGDMLSPNRPIEPRSPLLSCSVMDTMTADLVAIAAAVDAAVSDAARADWTRASRRHVPHLLRKPVRRVCGASFGYALRAQAAVPRQDRKSVV